MDEQHYEIQIVADPSADIDDTGLSAEDRRAAAAFRDEMRALDEKIAAALAIDVPAFDLPDLPNVDGDDNVTHISRSNKPGFTRPAWIAMAASVALVAVIGARLLVFDQTYPSLSAEIVAHLDHEPQALVVTSTPVAERELAEVVNSGNASIDRGVGLITYARSCVINGKVVPHLVMQGESGPITLLLMPGEHVNRATSLVGESINGVILPVGEGSIAIIGERDEDIDRIEKQVVDSVTWKI